MNNLSDLHVLKAFLDKKIYDNYSHLVDRQLLAEQTKLLLSEYRYYFAKSESEYIDIEDFKCWFFHLRYPDLSETNRRNYTELLDNVKVTESFLVNEIIKHYQGQKAWNQMEETVNKDGFDFSKLKEILQNYEIESQPYNNISKEEFSIDFCSVFDEVINPRGLNWRLDCLNDVAPHISHGDFIIVVASVNTGKTSFLASEVSYMAQQLGKNETVLWLSNEGRKDRILRRLCCATLERKEQVIIKDLERAQKIYEERMGAPDKVKVINIAGYSLANVKALFEQHKPSLAVIDQVTHIRHNIQNPVERLEYICQYVRELSIQHCPILGIAQASSNVKWTDKEKGTERSKIWLSLDDVYGSKVGIQGAAEIVIGIGKDNEKPNSRFIHVSKTKNGKNLQQEVSFDYTRALYLPGFTHAVKRNAEEEQ